MVLHEISSRCRRGYLLGACTLLVVVIFLVVLGTNGTFTSGSPNASSVAATSQVQPQTKPTDSPRPLQAKKSRASEAPGHTLNDLDDFFPPGPQSSVNSAPKPAFDLGKDINSTSVTGWPTTDPTLPPAIDTPLRPTTSQATTSAPILPTQKTMDPTITVTTNLSKMPTADPTSRPTHNPSLDWPITLINKPTRRPTHRPTPDPSPTPTMRPTLNPMIPVMTDLSHVPIRQRTRPPFARPSQSPLPSPPTFNPSSSSTTTTSATMFPTNKSLNPTITVTTYPSRMPTAYPTSRPTHDLSFDPTITLIDEPSQQPTYRPTHSPSPAPTVGPTLKPMILVTTDVTEVPIRQRTRRPFTRPTQSPLASPPTLDPSSNSTTTTSATMFPTNVSIDPTITVTTNSSRMPTADPTSMPTHNPSLEPMITTTDEPSRRPTNRPTPDPSPTPTMRPTLKPMILATTSPSKVPTRKQTSPPIAQPTQSPLASPSTLDSRTSRPSYRPLSKFPSSVQTSPSPIPMLVFDDNGVEVLYRPGFLTVRMHGLILSEGLTARIIADERKHVLYVNGQESTELFHQLPDFGATFVDTRAENPGGWVYVSNSEMNVSNTGGVGAVTFNANGGVIDYRMVLTNTTMNCGGGRTPWHTWVSCEEVEEIGSIYQVDPLGVRVAQPSTLGKGFGRFESFTFDVRNTSMPRFFASEDRKRGAVRRFTPDIVDWEFDPWMMLHGEGLIEFLLMQPTSASGGSFIWTTDERAARNSAESYYPECEGIDVNDGTMYLIAKNIKILFIIDLDAGTYEGFSTEHGVFDGNPDQVSRILNDGDHDMIYFTEEGGENAGVHGRNALGQFFTILEGPAYIDETTGLTFSPDGKHLYVAYQKNGILFDVTRVDQLSFQGKTLNVKYHNMAL